MRLENIVLIAKFKRYFIVAFKYLVITRYIFIVLATSIHKNLITTYVVKVLYLFYRFSKPKLLFCLYLLYNVYETGVIVYRSLEHSAVAYAEHKIACRPIRTWQPLVHNILLLTVSALIKHCFFVTNSNK